MKTNINLFVLAVAALSFAACAKTQTYVTNTYTGRSQNIKGVELNAEQTIVDLRVDFTKHIQGESDWCLSEKTAKEQALYNAVMSGNGDVVIEPIYRIETRTEQSSKSYSKEVKAYVVGYAGFYTNPRQPIDELQRLKNIDMETIEKHILLSHPEMLPQIKKSQESRSNVTVNNNYAEPAPAVSHTSPAEIQKTARKK